MEDVLRCPKCHIKQGKYRSGTNDYRCAVCGHIYSEEKVDQEVKE